MVTPLAEGTPLEKSLRHPAEGIYSKDLRAC